MVQLIVLVVLFVEIQDTDNVLSHIRQKLGIVSNEIAALDYYPHITLGFIKTSIVVI